MPQSLVTVRDTLVTALRDALAPLKPRDVDGHPGAFTADELRRLGAHAPGVLLAATGIEDVDEETPGEITARMTWSAYVIGGGATPEARALSALALLQGLLQTVPGNRWGLDADRPERITATNVYAGRVDELGVALWAVTWRQRHRIADLTPADLADFQTFHADYDIPAHESAATQAEWATETYTTQPDAQDTVTGLDT